MNGDSKGHYVYVNITSKASKNGHAKSEVAANKSPAIEAEEIKDEIGRIRDQEERAIELDDAKVWADIYSHLEPAKVIKDITPRPLTQVERNAVAAALMGELDYASCTRLRNHFGMRQALRNINEKEISQMLRYFMITTLATAQINGKMDGNILLLVKVASSYWPKIKTSYETAQGEKATLHKKEEETGRENSIPSRRG